MIKKFLVFLFLIPCWAFAQKPIILVVPFSAGGPTDLIAKVVQKTLSQELNRPVILEYKPGAGGDIANAYVAAWSREETVLLLQSSALATNQALNNPTWNKSALTPLVYFGSMPLLLVVPSNSKLSNLKAWQSLDPQTPVTWGSAGLSSSSHITGEIFKHKIQKNMIHVPYKGVTQFMPDLISGNINSAFIFVSTADPFIKSKQILPVAVASPHRIKNLPNVPTFGEFGLSALDYNSWFILLGNQNNNSDEQRRIQQVMMSILSDKNQKLLFQQVGLEINPRVIDQSFVLKEIHRYQQVVKMLNLKD
jgi:tripartite-type tricarboxylate transporter receptor subunit TctC